MTPQLTGMRRLIWIGGLLVSLMFILIMFVLIVLSILDSNYEHIVAYVIFAGYGILHLVTNVAFKHNRKWGRPGLLTLYSLWIVYSVYKALSGSTDELALLTAVIVALGSAVMIALLTLAKPGASPRTRQAA
jgi:peptidoglycan/LPS O-acetylase OafA/YrhL